jgi:uncharacterized protein (DUF4415 family)
MTDEEDAAMTAAAEADPDNPPIPDDAKFVTYQEARRRGRPRVPSPKQQVTLRLDGEVVDGTRPGRRLAGPRERGAERLAEAGELRCCHPR